MGRHQVQEPAEGRAEEGWDAEEVVVVVAPVGPARQELTVRALKIPEDIMRAAAHTSIVVDTVATTTTRMVAIPTRPRVGHTMICWAARVQQNRMAG